MVEDDVALADAIAERLEREGRAVLRAGDASTLTAIIAEDEDAVVVVTLPVGEVRGGVSAVQPWRTDPLAAPLIYIASRDDMDARLAAQGLGATRLLTQPLDMDRLMLMVDAHLLHMPERPYRVLLVEGDAARLGRHAAELRARGMEVEAVADPFEAHAAAVRARAECIVLERDMAGANADTLAAVLRADGRFQDTPIVYLLGPGDGEHALPLLEGGGETCLPTAVAADTLAACIILKVRRARSLRRMSEDLRAALRESRLLRLALDVHALVCITDPAGVIAYVNDAFCRASGYRRRELLGQDLDLLKSGIHPADFHDTLDATIRRGEVWRGELCLRRRDGSLYWVETSIVPSVDEGGRLTRFLWVGSEITRLKALEAQIGASDPTRRP